MPDLVMPRPQPFFFLEHHAAERPAAVALSTIERDFTYAELHGYATSIAGLFRRRGVRPGDVVVSHVRNQHHLLFMEAVFHEAAIYCSAPTIADVASMGYDWLLSHDPLDAVPADKIIVIDDEFMQEVAEARYSDPALTYDSFTSVCRVTFSSGTTGTPRALATAVEVLGRPALGWMENRPFFSLIQGFGGSGAKAASSSIYLGDTYICPGAPDDNVTLAQRNFVSTLQASPAQLVEFLDLLGQRENRHTDIAEVQFVGSFLSQKVLDRVRSELGATVTALYGSSEIGMISMRTNVVDNPADVGPPFSHAVVQIVDEDDLVLPSGTEGIVRIRSSRRAANYFRAATPPPSEHDGWTYPGDLGFLSDLGHLVLTGRSAEVINAGGVKFNAALMDEFLTAQEGVRDGAIIAFPDGEGLPGYAALVVADDNFSLHELIEPLRLATGGVAPASIIRVGAVQRDANGKVPRAALKAGLLDLLRANDRTPE